MRNFGVQAPPVEVLCEEGQVVDGDVKNDRLGVRLDALQVVVVVKVGGEGHVRSGSGWEGGEVWVGHPGRGDETIVVVLLHILVPIAVDTPLLGDIEVVTYLDDDAEAADDAPLVLCLLGQPVDVLPDGGVALGDTQAVQLLETLWKKGKCSC